jgi:hypothetical protein
VGGEANPVGVEAGEGRRAGRIGDLDINQGPGMGAIEAIDDDIWLLRQPSAGGEHPVSHRLMRACPLRDDTVGAEGGSEDGGEGVAGGVVYAGVEADAMRALNEMAAVRTVGGGAAGTAAPGAVRGGAELGRADEEVEREGGGVVCWVMEAEAGGGRDPLEPCGGTGGGATVEEAGAAVGW